MQICRAFGARLVLHHNLAAISPGFARAWDWEASHQHGPDSMPAAERRLKAVLDRVPETIAREAAITSGPVGAVLLALAEQLPADLVVLGSHGWSTPDHASVTERLIERAPCPILALPARATATSLLGEGGGAEPIRVAVPTDLSSTAQAAVTYALELARVLPLHLELLHVLSTGDVHPDDTALQAKERIAPMVPADLADRISLTVRMGKPVDEIVGFIETLRPAFVVMGQHAPGFLRHFFTRDTAREVVHRAPCPVWVVPAPEA